MSDNIVKDVLQIKQIERAIGRKLDAMDIEAIYMHEPIYYQKRNGQLVSYIVALYVMPYDLMNKDLEMAVALKDYETKDFFQFAFATQVVKRG